MISRTRLILIALVSVVLLIGVGFAAITSTQLNITGNTVANPDQSNFIVKFLETTEVSDTGKVTAEVVDDTHATLEVRGLVTKSDYVTATYIMKNMSDDLSADITIAIGNNNEEYFSTTAELEKTSLKAGEEAKIVVRVELIKVPKTQDETAKITAIIEATPVQPGEEGTSGALPPELPTPVTPSELFDPTGENPDGLHIGDFVNYDAGTWTEEEINSIQTGLKTSLVTANNSTSLPTQGFQFGGFTAGSSRNGNATPYSTTYNYVKDKETGKAITGWRVFDVEGDTVTLISAGNPEDYYHPYASGQSYGYISEYILTGNINSNWSSGATEAEKYQKRNWDMYVNKSQYGESATVLTKTMLDEWYTKYTNTPNADTWTDATFQKIYQEPYTKYQNMIENYLYYWLSSALNSAYVYRVNPYGRSVDSSGSYAFGVRAVVSLKSNVQFTATKAGTKTVTGGNTSTYGGNQTYNVWDIY